MTSCVSFQVLYCDAELFERIKEFPEHAVWKIFLLVLRARVILQLDDSVALSAAGYTSMADLLFMCEEEEVEGMFIPREGINMDKFSSVANFFETHGVLDFDKDWNTMYSFVEDYVAFPFSSGSAALQPGRILEPHLWWALNGLKLDAQGEQVGSRLIECFKQWYGSYVDHATVAFMQYPSGAPPQ
jgi:hypothetical protein